MHTEVSTPFPGYVVLSPRCLEGRNRLDALSDDVSGTSHRAEFSRVLLSVQAAFARFLGWGNKEIPRLIIQNRRHTLLLQALDNIKDVVRIEWPSSVEALQLTNTDFVPACKELDAETAEFVGRKGLRQGIAWMQMAIPRYFPGSDFEFDVVCGEEGESPMLAVKIYGELQTLEFRSRRDAMCEAMREAGHANLHEVVGIFQRRTQRGEWQGLSWYRSVLAE